MIITCLQVQNSAYCFLSHKRFHSGGIFCFPLNYKRVTRLAGPPTARNVVSTGGVKAVAGPAIHMYNK